MGGNAFKSSLGEGSIRLDKSEYDLTKEEVIIRLRLNMPGCRFSEVLPYRNKESFGDLDILFSTREKIDYNFVAKMIGATDVHRNGNVTSFAIPKDGGHFQVDLVKIPSESFEFAFFYFGYNDLGNLLGRIYHKMGFKLGFDGLKYVVRATDNPNWKFDELIVTRNVTDALKFAGYDPITWYKGFDDLEDVYKYVYSNGFARKQIYLLENRNHISRTRDAKRKTYRQFLLWLERQPEYPTPDIEKQELREIMFQRALDMFPSFDVKYQETKMNMERQIHNKKKFNGNLVREWTGLDGMDLGMFMKHYKSIDGHEGFITLANSDVIKYNVMSEFKKFKTRDRSKNE